MKIDIIKKVASLNLPIGTYVVFGSGPMAAKGLREVRDIDLLVTKGLYAELKSSGWTEKNWDSGGSYLEKNGIGSKVISVPCQELFWQQTLEYQMAILCNNTLKVAIEAGMEFDVNSGGEARIYVQESE